MEEFLSLKWGYRDLSQFERQSSFLSENVVSDSLVYKQFDKPLRNTGKQVKVFENRRNFVCGQKFFIHNHGQSCLNANEHEHCLKALKIIESGTDVTKLKQSELTSMNIYQELKPKIAVEHEKYFRNALVAWEKLKLKWNAQKGQAFVFVKEIWTVQCKRFQDYPQRYQMLSTFNMTYTPNETCIEFNCLQNALELGTLARFSQPNLNNGCTLKFSTLPKVEYHPSVHSKLPVSRDANITKLLQMHNVDVVISAAGLKRITDNYDHKVNWIIPIVVREISIKSVDGKMTKKQIVFVDKPLPQTNPNYLNLAYTAFKRLLKTNFCQYEAFKFPTEDIPVVAKSDETEAPNEDLTDPKTEAEPNEWPRNLGTIKHNVSYRIWNLKKSDQQNTLMKSKGRNIQLNVLIRSKLDGCQADQGSLVPVILRPKLERQLSFGAGIPTKSELARDWTSLFFTPYSILYKARLQYRHNEVVTLDKWTIQKVVSDSWKYYQYKPHLGLGVLEKVFSELVQLQPGNYLLRHLSKHEGFVDILKQCDEAAATGTSNSFDLHKEHAKCSVSSELHHPWLPLDTNYILPIFEANKRMPCMFTPFERKKFKKKYGGKKRKMNKGKPVKAKCGSSKETKEIETQICTDL